MDLFSYARDVFHWLSGQFSFLSTGIEEKVFFKYPLFLNLPHHAILSSSERKYRLCLLVDPERLFTTCNEHGGMSYVEG